MFFSDDGVYQSSTADGDDSRRTLLHPENTAKGYSHQQISSVLNVAEGAPWNSSKRGYRKLGWGRRKSSPSEEGFSLPKIRIGRSSVQSEYSRSSRAASSFGGDFAVGKAGWWKQQMLIDRSFRSMAALTALFAIIMLVICAVNLPRFLKRSNTHSTSVGPNIGQSCAAVERQNVVRPIRTTAFQFSTVTNLSTSTKAINLVINIAATMILGMSNTYQQIVTALRADEIRWVLSKFGDSRVGTNSPLSINHKKKGKLGAWLSWLLLISTSLVIIPFFI